MKSDPHPHNPLDYRASPQQGGLRVEPPAAEPYGGQGGTGESGGDGRSPHDALLQILWRQKWVIALFTLLGVAIAGAYVMMATPQYLGFARLYVQQAPPPVTGDGSSSLTQLDEKLNVYTQRELITSTANLA